MTTHHIGRTPTLQQSKTFEQNKSRPIMLGVRLRIAMEQESLRLWRDWRLEGNEPKRHRIAQRINAISLLLGSDDQRLIGVGDD